MTLRELEGETGILGKCENWGIFILRIGDRILMNFDILKEFMSQSSYFKSRPDLLTSGELEGEILENTWSGGIGMKLGG